MIIEKKPLKMLIDPTIIVVIALMMYAYLHEELMYKDYVMGVVLGASTWLGSVIYEVGKYYFKYWWRRRNEKV